MADVEAGVASDGVGIAVNDTDRKSAIDGAIDDPVPPHPASNYVDANTPKGSMGAQLKNLSNWRREVCGRSDMLYFPPLGAMAAGGYRRVSKKADYRRV